jgi:hypothetical protein
MEMPAGWGVLVESNHTLDMARKRAWHDNDAQARIRLLQRIAVAGTRQFNRAFLITREEITATDKFAGLGFRGQ